MPSKAPGPGSYPEPDAKHARAAAGLAGMHGSPKVKAAVKKKAKQKGFEPMHKTVAKQMLGGY